MGLESRSATKPSFRTPAAIITAPTISASNDASATAFFGSPPEPTIGRIAAAIIGPRDESGPSTRIRDGPKSAYPTRQRIVVYSPVITGRPASSAYAMPCGTSSVVSTMPATTSLRSHAIR